MAINFPSSPNPGDIYTYNGYIWEYVSGGYWKSVTESDYIYSATTSGSGTSVIADITGGNLYLKSFSGDNISISESNGVLIFSAGSSSVSGNYLPLSGGTVTGATNYTAGLTANTFSATTYQNLPVSAVTNGTGISTSTTNGTATITNTAPDQTITISGGTGITTGGTYPNFTLVNSAPDQTVTISGGTGITTGGTYPNFTLVNSAPDQTVSITGGTDIQITGTYPNFGVNFTGSTGGGLTFQQVQMVAFLSS